jgi:hypothetical protein
MQEALLISQIVLWIVVLVVAGLQLALLRQVGVLHERIAPLGALTLDKGPKEGEAVPRFDLFDLGRRAVTIGGEGAREEHERFIEMQSLVEFPYVLSHELGMTFRVGKLPYAVLIDEAGVVRAKGLINTREHLESLIEAKELGVASIQDYLQTAQKKTG